MSNFRERISLQFAAKPSTGPTLEQARKINADRLAGKQAALIARISKLVESLPEGDCDDWLTALDNAEQVKLSASSRGLGARLKSTYLTGKAKS